MKAVVVLEFDTEDIPVQDLLSAVSQGIDLTYVSEHGEVSPVRNVNVAVDEHADWVTDVFLEPQKGGGNHYVIWNEKGAHEGWTLEHSLACRRSNEMWRCPIHQLVQVGVNAGHLIPTTPGTKLKVTLDESGALLWQ